MCVWDAAAFLLLCDQLLLLLLQGRVFREDTHVPAEWVPRAYQRHRRPQHVLVTHPVQHVTCVRTNVFAL